MGTSTWACDLAGRGNCPGLFLYARVFVDSFYSRDLAGAGRFPGTAGTAERLFEIIYSQDVWMGDLEPCFPLMDASVNLGGLMRDEGR